MSFGTIQAEKVTTESGYSLGAGNASSFKNRIINGGMVIDQRNAGASVSASASTNSTTWGVDRWGIFSSSPNRFTMQQNAGSVTPPSGFRNYQGITSTSAYTPAAGETSQLYHNIEGFNSADLMWGTASAQSVTVSFWVRSSLTGNFGGAVTNEAQNRSYPFLFAINAANTWEQKFLTIPGDTSGTWVTGNGRGITLIFDMATGSNFKGTAGVWASANLYSATGANLVFGTNGATFYITGVQLEVGTVATSFDFRSYGTELALCQRYYELGPTANYVWLQSTTAGKIVAQYQVAKRASASISTVSGGTYLQQNIGDTFPSGNNTNIGTLTFTVASNISNVSGFGADFTISNPTTVGTGFTIFWNNASRPLWAASSEL